MMEDRTAEIRRLFRELWDAKTSEKALQIEDRLISIFDFTQNEARQAVAMANNEAKVALFNLSNMQAAVATGDHLKSIKVRQAIHPVLEWLAFVWSSGKQIGNMDMDLIPELLKVMIETADDSWDEQIRVNFYRIALENRGKTE